MAPLCRKPGIQMRGRGSCAGSDPGLDGREIRAELRRSVGGSLGCQFLHLQAGGLCLRLELFPLLTTLRLLFREELERSAIHRGLMAPITPPANGRALAEDVVRDPAERATPNPSNFRVLAFD